MLMGEEKKGLMLEQQFKISFNQTLNSIKYEMWLGTHTRKLMRST